ncbi:MAG: hypothetical protein ACI8R8_003374 [Paraglaciecola sp.]|jgi:hypothetical protein
MLVQKTKPHTLKKMPQQSTYYKLLLKITLN